jgi:hypothetical protein
MGASFTTPRRQHTKPPLPQSMPVSHLLDLYVCQKLPDTQSHFGCRTPKIRVGKCGKPTPPNPIERAPQRVRRRGLTDRRRPTSCLGHRRSLQSSHLLFRLSVNTALPKASQASF